MRRILVVLFIAVAAAVIPSAGAPASAQVPLPGCTVAVGGPNVSKTEVQNTGQYLWEADASGYTSCSETSVDVFAVVSVHVEPGSDAAGGNWCVNCSGVSSGTFVAYGYGNAPACFLANASGAAQWPVLPPVATNFYCATPI